MKKFELTILGCGAAAPTPYFLTTSQLVNIHDNLILIDCGEGTQLTLRKNKTKFQRIKSILISHMHADHTLGLPGLIASMNLLGRKSDLDIYGPEELEPMVRKVWHLTGTHIEFEVHFHVTCSNASSIIIDERTFTVKSFPTKHRIPTCGFVISEKKGAYKLKPNMKKRFSLNHLEIQKLKRGEDIEKDGKLQVNSRFCNPPDSERSYAFAADTSYSLKVVDAVENCTLLYHEATFEKRDDKIAKKTLHSTSEDAARVAKNAKVGSLLIGHFSNRYCDLTKLLNEAKAIFSKTELSIEGKTYFIK